MGSWKIRLYFLTIFLVLIFIPVLSYFTKNENSEGPRIRVEFQRGESFYYPLMAIWLEYPEGNYIRTLFVPESVATSVYRFYYAGKDR